MNRSNNVAYTLNHAGGQITKNLNQTTGGGAWALLGTYAFNIGNAGYVEVSDVNGLANADAVKFVPVP